MRIADILKKTLRISETEQSMSFIRNDAEAVLVCVRFKDGHIHYMMPNQKEVVNFTRDLMNIIMNNDWNNTMKRYEDQKMEPLIDEREFRV